MKKLLSVTVTLLCFINCLHAQNFQWVKQIGSSGLESGYEIRTDISGNIYVAGVFNGTVDFDPGAAVFTMTSDTQDIFIEKLNSSGDLIWAKRIGRHRPDYINTMEIDQIGNVYLAGNFKDTIDFDPGPAVYNLISMGNDDDFILKLNASGNFVWARRTGNENYDYCGDIDVQPDNSIFITGAFIGTVDFDPGSATHNLSSTQQNMFIQKLDSNGNYVGAQRIGTGSVVVGYNIETDYAGNIFTSGVFTNTQDFDPGIAVQNLTSIGASIDIFVMKLTSAGVFSWACSLGSAQNDEPFGFAIDDSGNVITTGSFYDSPDFDPGAGIFTLTSNGLSDSYVWKLDANGNFRWAKSMGSAASEYGLTVAKDNAGNIYSSGKFSNTLDLDPGTGILNFTANGVSDIYIQKLTTNGDFEWTKQIGGSNIETCNSLVIDNSGNLFATGSFRDTVDFNADAGVFNLISASPNVSDLFVLKLDPANNCASCPIPTNITSANITGTAATINWDGNSCAVKYRVRYRVQGTTTWTTKIVTAPIVTKTLTALQSLTTYEYQIRTDCNSAGTTASAYSAIQTFTTICTCSKPTNITITNLKQTTAKVNWVGNNCAVKYRLQYRKQGTTAWTTKTVTAPTLFYTITGLTNNTIYEYHLRSDCNSTGSVNSGWTTTTTFTTPLRMEDDESVTSLFSITPNPCNTCEVRGAENANDLTVTDILGRKLNAEFTQSANGYYINLPAACNGILFIRNSKTGEVVKFIKE